MERFNTPPEVAELLAEWAPRRLTSLLEPAVGNGALLAPLVHRIRRSRCRVICVDVDKCVSEQFMNGIAQTILSQITLFCDDFLSLERDILVPADTDGFDCIIMNPPFSARETRIVDSPIPGVAKRVPVELAFLVKAVGLLSAKGRILSIVPASLVSSMQGKWLRDYLLSCGNICYVHELPRNTFRSVEARSYLMIFEMRRSSRPMVLCNHSLQNPEKIVVSCNGLGAERRLDFSFQKARYEFDGLMKAFKGAQWIELRDLAEVSRGLAASPQGLQRAIHTIDFDEGFWSTTRLAGRGTPVANRALVVASCQDILMMRVGRHCYQSAGCIREEGSFELTDCVFRIRPKLGVDKLRLLFALRCALSWEVGRDLMQRGGGASYVVLSDLESLRVPFGLSSLYPRLFFLYAGAFRSGRFDLVTLIEKLIQARMRLRLNNRRNTNGQYHTSWESIK